MPFTTYYNAEDGMTVKEIVHRWVEDKKAYDRSMPIMMDINDVWQYREYDWTRETSRSGDGWPYYSPEGEEEQALAHKRIFATGQEKWDRLVKSMLKYGWDKREPIIMHAGRDGNAKIGEGNHRIAVAMSLLKSGQTDFGPSFRSTQIPVRFIFTSKVYQTEIGRPPKKATDIDFKEWLR